MNNKSILDKVKVQFVQDIDFNQYPFSVSIIKNLKDMVFNSQVTFIVGENGTGKSTLLEAIAHKVGFGFEGGSKNIQFKTSQERTYAAAQLLAQQLTLSWRLKPKNGYFFRAETFFNIANYLDYLQAECGGNAYGSYGGKSLHEQSHGESFLSFFGNRLGEGFFILDEPEAALSPQKQLSLIAILHETCRNQNTQFLIATHSPILLAYPNATIYSCDSGTLTKIAYTDTSHYLITKQFLDNPDLYLFYLLKD